jgi:hypothetical protein
MMTKVKITNEAGQQVNGYIDNGYTEDQKKRDRFKEKLHITYLLLGIAAFSFALLSHLKRK